jgi:hypothetical protein
MSESREKSRKASSRANCVIFAFKLWFRRLRKGDCSGYVSIRKSRHGPFIHALYQYGNHFVSFVPIEPKERKVPPALFDGRVKWGDKD